MTVAAKTKYRALLIAAVAIPALPLGYFGLHWLPRRWAAAALEAHVGELASAISAQDRALRAFRDGVGVDRHGADANFPWLAHRDARAVFDSLSRAFEERGVALDHVRALDPEVRFSGEERLALHQERVEIACRGDFESLTRCLDRLESLAMPHRVTNLDWHAQPDGDMRLALRVAVPYVAENPAAKADEPGGEE